MSFIACGRGVFFPWLHLRDSFIYGATPRRSTAVETSCGSSVGVGGRAYRSLPPPPASRDCLSLGKGPGSVEEKRRRPKDFSFSWGFLPQVPSLFPLLLLLQGCLCEDISSGGDACLIKIPPASASASTKRKHKVPLWALTATNFSRRAGESGGWALNMQSGGWSRRSDMQK